ncbi:MAG: pectate lyase [Opitutaceae bacterium]
MTHAIVSRSSSRVSSPNSPPLFPTRRFRPHRDCILTLLDAEEKLGREEYRDAARRGIDFLLLAQLPDPQPAWAQQYDANMQPAWARAFEPPSITAGESAGIINLLLDMDQEFGDTRCLDAARKAGGWLQRSAISPGRWARLYELETNRPICGDRDGRIHYTLEEISEERRRGYGWEGGFGIERALKRMQRIQNADTPEPSANRASRPSVSHETASKILSELEESGRWVTEQRASNSEHTRWISPRTFIANMEALSDWLEERE